MQGWRRRGGVVGTDARDGDDRGGVAKLGSFLFFKQKTASEIGLGIPAEPLFRSIASALAGGAMSKLFGGGQKAASGGIQGDVLATDNNTVGMGDAGIKSAIQGSNVPNPDEA